MMKTKDILEKLKKSIKNTDIDWEFILECNYLYLLSELSGLGAIDVGGHAGRHSRVLMETGKIRHMMIFEPLPEQFQKLCEMFSRHGSIKVFQIALGNRSHVTTFKQNLTSPEESGLCNRSFYNLNGPQQIVELQVQIERLDAFHIPFPVHYIKIDTEGGEIDTLKGAKQLLQRDGPVVSVEYGPGGYDAYGYGSDTLFELATEIDYYVYDLFGNRFDTLEEWRSCVAQYYWDFLLIPKNNVSFFRNRLDSLGAHVAEEYFKLKGCRLPLL